MPAVRFILLSTYRSGTTFLRTMLDAHPQVRCFSEFYCYDYQFWDFEQEKRADAAAFAQCKALHASDPIAFVERYGFRPDDERTHASGFTLQYDQPLIPQPETLWNWLAADRDIRIIDLQRRDELLRYASYLRAMMSQDWVRLGPSSTAPQPVRVEPVAFLAATDRLRDLRQRALDRLAGHPTIPVAYEDLVADPDREVGRIFEFLGVKPIPAKPGTLKQRESDPRSYISNYDELQQLMVSGPTTGVLTDDVLARIRTALLETYFKGTWIARLESDAARSQLEYHVRWNFEECREWLVPWLRRYVDLSRTHVVQLGTETGADTAAIALEAKRVSVHDVPGPRMDAARRRLEILGIGNVAFHEDSSEAECVRHHAPGSVDCVVLYALLHKKHYRDALAIIRAAWEVLRPGGLLIVGETVNRLAPFDQTTSMLPFFPALPAELALDYAPRSPRPDFRNAIANARAQSDERALDVLARRGRGVSYHEFEVELGDLGPLIAGDGFDPEPLMHFGVSLETRFLYSYARRKGIAVPPAFLSDPINVILRKPDPAARPASPPPRDLDAIIRPLVDPPGP